MAKKATEDFRYIRDTFDDELVEGYDGPNKTPPKEYAHIFESEEERLWTKKEFPEHYQAIIKPKTAEDEKLFAEMMLILIEHFKKGRKSRKKMTPEERAKEKKAESERRTRMKEYDRKVAREARFKRDFGHLEFYQRKLVRDYAKGKKTLKDLKPILHLLPASFLSSARPAYVPKTLRPMAASKREIEPFATIDIEVQSWTKYVCGGLYTQVNKKDVYVESGNLHELMKSCFIFAQEHGVTNFLAHYGGKFDFLHFLSDLACNHLFIIVKMIPRSSAILAIEVVLNPHECARVGFPYSDVKITFRDSFALLPFSLGMLTKTFKTESSKGEVDFDFIDRIYADEPYQDEIISRPDRYTSFLNGKQLAIKQIKKLSITDRKNIRYWNHSRHQMNPAKKKIFPVKFSKKDKLDKRLMPSKIDGATWLDSVTYPIFTKAQLLDYLFRDCKGLYQVLEKFFNSGYIKFAKKSWTAAAQAVNVYRLFMPRELHSIPDSEEFQEGNVDAFVRSAYFGGRTEVFKPIFDHNLHDAPWLYYADVNSLYPTVMARNPFPDRFLGWKYGEAEYNKAGMAIWHCKVEVPKDMHIPPLPVKNEGKLIFPVGVFTGTWTKYELEYSKTLGVKILDFYEGATFENAGMIFKRYIDTLYAARLKAKEAGDDVTQTSVKLLMNSTYGKMGMNKERANIIFDDGRIGARPMREIKVNDKEIHLAEVDADMSKAFSNVTIACYVTSYARVHLHKEIVAVGPDHVYYCDSVTKDRKMMVLDKDNNVKVLTIEEIYHLQKIKDTSAEMDRAFGSDLKTVSWNPDSNQLEFKPITYVYRHKNKKRVFEVYNNKGRSVITEDHSLIDENNTRLKFTEATTLFSPKNKFQELCFRRINEVDLLSLFEGREYKGFGRYADRKLKFNDEWIWFQGEYQTECQMIKRRWKGRELEELMFALAFYISEGSVSTPESTKSRFMFQIGSEKVRVLERIKLMLEENTSGVKFAIRKSSNKDNTMKLASGTMLLAYFFKNLGGQKSIGKKMPDFVFNLEQKFQDKFFEGLMNGDAGFCHSNAYTKEYKDWYFNYSTQSYDLACSLSLLLNQNGFCHSVHYRPEKRLYTLSLSKENRVKPVISREISYDDYVYDLSVEGNQNFFDALGLIGLHNTDSVFADKEMRFGKELGELKLEYRIKSACFLAPKTYVNEGIIHNDGTEQSEAKVVMKGFDYKKIKGMFTVNDFINYLHGDNTKIFVEEEPKFASLKTALQQGTFVTMRNDPEIQRTLDIAKEAEYQRLTGKKKKFVKEEYKKSIRKLQSEYDKRIIVDNGLNTRPLVMGEDAQEDTDKPNRPRIRGYFF